MRGNLYRQIEKQGVEMEIHNAVGGGGRTMPDYSEDAADGVKKMVSEQRGMGRTVTDSSGTEVEANLEFRHIPDEDDPDIIPAGDDQPTRLKHPSGVLYRVMDIYREDSGAEVLTVVED